MGGSELSELDKKGLAHHYSKKFLPNWNLHGQADSEKPGYENLFDTENADRDEYDEDSENPDREEYDEDSEEPDTPIADTPPVIEN